MHALVRRHIEDAVHIEWPEMARQRATLTVIPRPLGSGLQLALSLQPTNDGQTLAQREMVAPLENASTRAGSGSSSASPA